MERKGIKNLRLSFGLSQERFAQLLGVSLQTVRRWEGGLTRPLPIIIQRLEELQRKIGGVGMTEKRKKEGVEIDFGLGGLFKGISSLFDLVSKMVEEGKEEVTRIGEIKGLGEKVKGMYGFTVKMGIGGKPIIEQFGNIKKTPEGPVIEEEREPLSDVFDEKDEVVVIAEIPGVSEDGISLDLKGDILEISAVGKNRKYRKEVLLPVQVKKETLSYTYKNGIVEVRIKKINPHTNWG